jgi:hypothetical protein
MGKTEKLKKYEHALESTLQYIESHPAPNFTLLRKTLKINKNFFTALKKLRIIEKIGIRMPRYVVLKPYSPELALQVLTLANELSSNKKEDLIENFTFYSIEAEKPQPEKKLKLLQKIIKTLFNGSI